MCIRDSSSDDDEDKEPKTPKEEIAPEDENPPVDDQDTPRTYVDVSKDQQFSDSWANELSSIAQEGPAGKHAIESVQEYSMESYVDINGGLRRGEKLSTKTQKQIDGLDYVCNKRSLDQDIVVFRRDDGAGLPNAGEGMTPKQWKGLEGTVINDAGFTSTSVNHDSAKNFRGNIMYEIRVPKSSRGAYIKTESNFPPEDEFLLGRGYSFRIKEAKRPTRTRLGKVILEVIPDG